MRMLDLNGRKMWCGRHLTVAGGYGMEVLAECSVALASHAATRFMELGVADVGELQRAMEEAMPLCCHVGDDVMRDLYATCVPMN